MTLFVRVKTLPDSVQSALKAVNFGSEGVCLEASESISPSVAGGKGQKGYCIILNMATGERKEMFGSWGGSNLFNPNNQVDLDTKSYTILPGFAVIKGSIGEKTYATVYIHPDNMVKYLPITDTSLSDRDKWLLWTFDGLTSAGRKNEWQRSNDIPNENDLNSLAELGYLKRSKNGATKITVEGRNVLNRRAGQSIYHPNDPYFKK